jgi:hypothetical protein
MDQTVKHLSGHSGSTVLLKRNVNGYYVEKTGNVARNYERMTALAKHGHFRVPKIFVYSPHHEILKMEYISGLDMRTYLEYYPPNDLWDFISSVINGFDVTGGDMDVGLRSEDVLHCLPEENPFVFTKEQLLNRLPETLPRTQYIGDLTLENILWNEDDGFVIIDPVTVSFEHYLFDLAKLRQDTKCGWFTRKNPPSNNLLLSMKYLDDKITSKYPQVTDELLILMLLRVFRHCKKGHDDYNFVVQKANSLWT